MQWRMPFILTSVPIRLFPISAGRRKERSGWNYVEKVGLRIRALYEDVLRNYGK